MIYKRGWMQTLSRHELKILLEHEGISDSDKVVNILKGDDWQNEGPYLIVKYGWFRKEEVRVWQRANQLWFVPLYILSIPIQWLFTGNHGFKNESLVGKIISRITGLN